jgi:hypothetical protein
VDLSPDLSLVMDDDYMRKVVEEGNYMKTDEEL